MIETLKAAKLEAEARAQALSDELKVKVHPMVFSVGTDSAPVVGFIKEPSRAVKLAVMDKYAMGFYSACSQALDAIILKDHSDPRITSERPEDDLYYMGAVYAVSEMIQFAANHVDKKK
jgi:hypothetical protein